MHRIFLAACLMGFVVVAMGAAPIARQMKAGRGLEGKWKIAVTPDNDDANKPGVKKIDETLTFGPTQLSTEVLAAHGFGPADYTDDTRPAGPATFTCTQTSDKEGTIVWSGFTTGQDMQGTMVWTKKDGTVIHYAFTGSKS